MAHKNEIFKENRIARLTILIDPQKKKAFEELCDRLDTTPSQAIRQMIRDLLTKHEVSWCTSSSKRKEK
jgi:predicted transcriptional regulator